MLKICVALNKEKTFLRKGATINENINEDIPAVTGSQSHHTVRTP